jgi:hypothetical protein
VSEKIFSLFRLLFLLFRGFVLVCCLVFLVGLCLMVFGSFFVVCVWCYCFLFSRLNVALF